MPDLKRHFWALLRSAMPLTFMSLRIMGVGCSLSLRLFKLAANILELMRRLNVSRIGNIVALVEIEAFLHLHYEPSLNIVSFLQLLILQFLRHKAERYGAEYGLVELKAVFAVELIHGSDQYCF